MGISNPILSLKRLIDLEEAVKQRIITPDDLEEMDFFIAAAGGPPNYINSTLMQNGFLDYSSYIFAIKNPTSYNKIILGKLEGTIIGALYFLKTYAINNNL